MLVYDSWWPHRVGRVVKRTKTRVVVRWSDGKKWRYDKPHQRFLRRLTKSYQSGEKELVRE